MENIILSAMVGVVLGLLLREHKEEKIEKELERSCSDEQFIAKLREIDRNHEAEQRRLKELRKSCR